MEMTNDLNNKEDEARLLRQNLSTALEDMALLKVLLANLLKYSMCICYCTVHCHAGYDIFANYTMNSTTALESVQGFVLVFSYVSVSLSA
jgi:hypothetical protein